MAHPAGTQREVWVSYHIGSGSVVSVALQEPKTSNPSPMSGYARIKTRLSEWAIQHSHQLQMRSGQIVHSPSLGG